ncbi:DNA-binding protein [Clostridium sp. BNL1100]|uniref:DNA-binding protein n=1 Tax=Clostridium sp. BNL1100 TaxID=755731 RepID=UPI00024A7DC3|nr:DNA-binding protein [Clostridium sp. BNL1100]AEY65384.1 hypothetical protein Clo1100_1132 [Clostridium sp. BNL1100]
MTVFEKEVRKALIDKDMTVNKLAEEMGISSCYLIDILKGNRTGKKQKTKILALLGLDESICTER